MKKDVDSRLMVRATWSCSKTTCDPFFDARAEHGNTDKNIYVLHEIKVADLNIQKKVWVLFKFILQRALIKAQKVAGWKKYTLLR